MGIYETHKEDKRNNSPRKQLLIILYLVIVLTITSKATADKKIDWNEFIKELSPTIIDKYDKSPLAKYKGAWKHAFRYIAKEIGITRKRGKDHWEKIVELHIIQK